MKDLGRERVKYKLRVLSWHLRLRKEPSLGQPGAEHLGLPCLWIASQTAHSLHLPTPRPTWLLEANEIPLSPFFPALPSKLRLVPS